MNDLLEALKLVRDPLAKSESYYSLSTAPAITDSVVAALRTRLAQTGGSTVRICLHENPDSPFHEMVIVHKKGGVFKPHKHLEKDESYHMIDGILRIVIFSETGVPVETIRLGSAGTGFPFWIRIRQGIWHATIPETEYAVFHEARPGPFKGGDSILRDET
ncbi:MAG: cupin fold metalloprotein, WbuC family [Elusimicrobia bacterium]|nr:cupin fold metalloprotein, WbuC family [Elusimicrobiota bacterium]